MKKQRLVLCATYILFFAIGVSAQKNEYSQEERFKELYEMLRQSDDVLYDGSNISVYYDYPTSGVSLSGYLILKRDKTCDLTSLRSAGTSGAYDVKNDTLRLELNYRYTAKGGEILGKPITRLYLIQNDTLTEILEQKPDNELDCLHYPPAVYKRIEMKYTPSASINYDISMFKDSMINEVKMSLPSPDKIGISKKP